MMRHSPASQPASPSYLNPVYPAAFADPFVLKHRGEYWAYCTGAWDDGRCFGILHSRDLVHWRAGAGAMAPLPGDLPCYWAPEVSYYNGRFYLYYSAGNEQWMQIRVAVSDHPAGPFEDSGHVLTRELFAIDPHVFVDDTGMRYLFYATDFLDYARIGTGTVRDRLLDPFTLAGAPVPVTRACYDWQIYDPQRAEKGGVCWHTIEGSFVLKHKGLYYQMFSGGNWQNISYGVSYATSERVDAAEEWRQIADGERTLPILRTLPGKVIGPGHNSVVRGPDNRQLYCVYHRWAADGSGRQMAIDPLDWAGERMLVLGPSTTPRPAPTRPAFADYFDQPHGGELGPFWQCIAGQWSGGGGAAVQRAASGWAEARHALPAPAALIEVSMRLAEHSGQPGTFGVCLLHAGHSVLRCMIAPEQNILAIASFAAADRADTLALPVDFDPHADHLLRIEIDGVRVRLALDAGGMRWRGQLAAPADQVALCTDGAAAAFAGFALTIGWEDDFTDRVASPVELGWQGGSAGDWSIVKQHLISTPAEPDLALVKGPLLGAYELVLNARLGAEPASGGSYGWLPATRDDQTGPLIAIERAGAAWALAWRSADRSGSFLLPAAFDPYQHQQWRCRKRAGRLEIAWEGLGLGEIDVPPQPTRIGLTSDRATAMFDLVRVTALPEGINAVIAGAHNTP